MRRNTPYERKVLWKAHDLLAEGLAMRPQNPADIKQMSIAANTGMDKIEKARSAISTILSGPHADYDYIDIALSTLDIDKLT